MSETIKSIEQAIAKAQTKEGDTNVIIAKEKFRAIPQTMFVFLFIENLYTILTKHKLSQFDLKLMLLMLTKMQYGNQLQITQLALAMELSKGEEKKVHVQQISRAFTNLRASGILVKDEFGNIFFNLEVVLKGKFANIPEDYERQYKASVDTNFALKNATTPPFDLSLLKDQIKKSKKQKSTKVNNKQPENQELPFDTTEEF